MDTTVELLNSRSAQMGKSLLKLFQFFAGKHILFLALGTP